ncbi:MAG TPA: sulfotransferase [Anaerolineae bacterium]|nr:sulfotransferase [Anaerolineae bacterium]
MCPNKNRPLLVVVGCPRSGTSLFARLLAQSGLQTVDHHRTSSQYPAGYYEHLPLLMFHKALERLPRGADHRITVQHFLQSSYLDDRFIRQVFCAAWEPVSSRAVEFCKFPQLALSIDFVLEQFDSVHVVALWRNPLCTFKSLVTKEFPREMRPASGLKAIMLWNMYAFHLVQGARAHPRDVTVLSIDDLVDRDTDISPLLRRLGYEPAGENRPSACISRGVWTRRVSSPWWLYFHSMRLAALAARRLLPADKAGLADVAGWQRRVRAITLDLEDVSSTLS